MNYPVRCLASCLALFVAILLAADECRAQFTSKSSQSKNPAMNKDSAVLLPGLGVAPVGQNQQVTPEQALGIMQLRALQGRGRGQVKTGVPQFIPMGPQFNAPAYSNSPEPLDASRKSSADKRAEARKAREEKNAAARDEAKAKKAKVAEAKAAKEAKQDGAAAKKVKPVKNAKTDATAIKAKSVKKPAATDE